MGGTEWSKELSSSVSSDTADLLSTGASLAPEAEVASFAMAGSPTWTTLKKQGNDCIQKKEVKKAAALYTRALKAAEQAHHDQHEDSDCAAANDIATLRSNRAYALTLLSKAQQALSDATEAIRLCPNWPKAYYRKAVVLADLLQRPKDALDELQIAQSIGSSTASKDIRAKQQQLRKVLPKEHQAKGTDASSASASSNSHKVSSGLMPASVGTQSGCVGASGAETFLARAAKHFASKEDEEYKRIERAVTSAEHGKEGPTAIARAIETSAATQSTALQLASGVQELFFSATGKSKDERDNNYEQCLVEFERIREERNLSLEQLPLPEATGALVHASQSSNNRVSRKAFEDLSIRVLNAAEKEGNEMFESTEVSAMMAADVIAVIDKKLIAEEVHGDSDAMLHHACEAACGTLHNLLTQARRIGAEEQQDSDASDPYAELCALLERDDNPLDADTSSKTAKVSWDAQAAHGFFVPINSFFSFDERKKRVLSNLSVMRVRANIVDCVAASREDMARPLCNVLRLLQKLREHGSPPEVLRSLAEREHVLQFQKEAEAELASHKRFAQRIEVLKKSMSHQQRTNF